MDVGVFKVSRLRLILWLGIPPVLIVGMTMSSYILSLRSQWKLDRVSALSEVLPKLNQTRQDAHGLLVRFESTTEQAVRTEDQLISFLQDYAQMSGFQIDSLNAERGAPVAGYPVLVAKVRGSGTYEEIEVFLGDVEKAHHLISETSLTLSRIKGGDKADMFDVAVEFQMTLFKSALVAKGGGA